MNLQNNTEIIINKFKEKNYNFVIEKTNFLSEKENNNDLLWTLRGLSYLNKNNKIDSFKCLNIAVKINPKNIDAKNYLGILYNNSGKLRKAEKYFKECIQLNPVYISSIFNLANLKLKTNNFAEAISLYIEALKINENIEKIYINLGFAYQSTKQSKKAKLILEKCLNKFPSSTEADKLLSSQTNFKNDENYLMSMVKKLNTKQLNDDQKINLLFAIGKGFEDKEDYKKSFNYYSKGNYLKRSNLKSDINQKTKLFENIESFFSNFQFQNEIIDNKKKIIFIFGLPRSGTTLVESIISSHDKVSSVGEINFVSNFVKSNFFKDSKIIINDLDKCSGSSLKEEYFNYLESFNIKNSVITDKSLDTYFNLGFIKYFFPGSKLIHCQRNAKDNCLSIYKNLFTDNESWKYDENELIEYYSLYKRIMNFWNKKISKDILNINYEELVNNKESTVKKIINYCQLKWSEKCLNHHNYVAPIKTLSLNQANKPVYSKSIGSSNNYDIYLREMFDNLSLQMNK